jgi:hypothetical protein
MKALLRSAIPIAEVPGPNGIIPELSDSDVSDIAVNLSNVPRSYSFEFTGKITNGGKFILAFLPDARGFDVELIDLSVQHEIQRDHPAVMTVPFTIDLVGDEQSTAGVGDEILGSSVDDAKVYILERKEPVCFVEGVVQQVASQIYVEGANYDILKAYTGIANEVFWRSQDILVGRVNDAPYIDTIFGVGVSGRDLQFLNTKECTIDKVDNAITWFSGVGNVKYVYGDIRYPVDPMLSASKPKFDIISDDEEWTKFGPITERYIGGGNDADSVPETIFSWEGRSSTAPRTISKIVAGLEDY